MTSDKSGKTRDPGAVAEQTVARTKSTFREYAEAIGMALLLALFIRTFIVQAFKIPSGSMIPTLLIGDHILVNKLAYGVRIPLLEDYIFEFQRPQRGDVIVFIY
ncbi:MAG: signal peptidase I, partial [Deltaproteobacteria bacterium]|nr:signal peptidase I [Deltaproteobacteria bacterium]